VTTQGSATLGSVSTQQNAQDVGAANTPNKAAIVIDDWDGQHDLAALHCAHQDLLHDLLPLRPLSPAR
jgi:hypothetical protein